MIELEFLKEQNVSESLIHGIEEFRRNYNVDEGAAARVTRPSIPFYGKEILEMAIAGLLEGENLLLAGPKATGKNILAENLAYAFGRPVYNVSFHVNTNSGDLIGTDTFVNNEVCLRKGSIYQCAEYVGFGILKIHKYTDKLFHCLFLCLREHFAENKSQGFFCLRWHIDHQETGNQSFVQLLCSCISVVHGSDKTCRRMKVDPVIARNINGAAIVQSCMKDRDRIVLCHIDLIQNTEATILGTLIDAAMKIVRAGLSPLAAVQMGVVNKTFDIFEKEIVDDVVRTRIPEEWTKDDVYA